VSNRKALQAVLGRDVDAANELVGAPGRYPGQAAFVYRAEARVGVVWSGGGEQGVELGVGQLCAHEQRRSGHAGSLPFGRGVVAWCWAGHHLIMQCL